MTPGPQIPIRLATADDAGTVARLLHDFNTEFDEYSPGVEPLTERAGELLEAGELSVLLAGDEADGFAQLRFRPSVWSNTLDAYLEELYVVPALRGRGIGRALLEAAMALAAERGAGRIELGTSEDDTAALALYKSCGFTNLEQGARMLFYERELGEV